MVGVLKSHLVASKERDQMYVYYNKPASLVCKLFPTAQLSIGEM